MDAKHKQAALDAYHNGKQDSVRRAAAATPEHLASAKQSRRRIGGGQQEAAPPERVNVIMIVMTSNLTHSCRGEPLCYMDRVPLIRIEFYCYCFFLLIFVLNNNKLFVSNS